MNRGAGSLSKTTATAIALLLFVGCIGKSAQIPLHVWLPDAMEGPTPVSALIHAATMVTAGVFLRVPRATRSSSAAARVDVVAWVGAVTALLAGTVALVQPDIKRVLAYSHDQPARLHVPRGRRRRVHAPRSSWSSPRVLQGHAVPRRRHGDPRQRTTTRTCGTMGGLRRFMPVTALGFVIAWLAIAGIPPFSGFWAKDDDPRNAFSPTTTSSGSSARRRGLHRAAT